MRLLDLVQAVMSQLQLGIPTTVVSNFDPDVVQVKSLLTSAADEIVTRYPYTRTIPYGEWVRDSSGAGKTTPELDTDNIIFDGSLIIPAIIWRWQSANGFDYAENFRAVEERISRDAAKYTKAVRGSVTL